MIMSFEEEKNSLSYIRVIGPLLDDVVHDVEHVRVAPLEQQKEVLLGGTGIRDPSDVAHQTDYDSLKSSIIWALFGNITIFISKQSISIKMLAIFELGISTSIEETLPSTAPQKPRWYFHLLQKQLGSLLRWYLK